MGEGGSLLGLVLPDPVAVKLYRLSLEPHTTPPVPVLFESESLPLTLRTPAEPVPELASLKESSAVPAKPGTQTGSGLRRSVGLGVTAAATVLSVVGGGIYGYHYVRGYQQTVTAAEAEEILAGVKSGRVLGVVGVSGVVLGAVFTFVLP